MKRKVKRVLSALLAVVMVISMLTVGASAATVVDSGTCGDNLTWTLTDDGTLTICGTGNMDKYYSDTVPWNDNLERIRTVIIEEGVTSIGYGAFKECSILSDITIPDSITSIGAFSFKDCDSLTRLEIPNSVTLIDTGAFSNCNDLISIVLPNGITCISANLFIGCDSLVNITIPDNVTSIEDSAFHGCTSLSTLIIPNGVTSIGEHAFDNCCGLTDITIPNSVISIGERAFYNCKKLTHITIPEGITNIGEYTFSYCTNLTSVTLPSGITRIGDSAFRGCSKLTDIEIPAGVTRIGDSVFYSCRNLSSITIPNSVTSIGTEAFSGCYNLTGVIIPANVISIGQEAFASCGYLGTITFKGSAPTIGDDCFYMVKATAIYPIDDETWSDEVRLDYGGTLTWKPICPDNQHNYTTIVTDPTCLEVGYTTYTCDKCGDSYIDNKVPASGHTAVIDEAIQPTCTKDGLSEGAHCSVCDEVLVEQEVISATGHTEVIDEAVAPTCTETGLTEGKHCSVCGEILIAQEVVPATGHSFGEWTVVKAPTATENGLEERTCGVCGETECRTIPMIGIVFADVKSTDWFYPYVTEAAERGLMSGTGDNQFSPYGTTTRAMFVQILYAMAGKPEVTIDNPFTDVPENAWYAKAVQWAYENGVTGGTGDYTFSPNANVTREQIAVFLYAYAGKPAVSGDLSSFADSAKVSGWAKNAVIWATQNKIISGSSEGGKLYLNPKKNATRAETATMMVGFAKLMEE